MKVTSSTFEGCESLSDKIEAAKGHSPRYGPYSSSRLGGCGLKFKKSYSHLFDEEEDDPKVFNRFGTAEGKAVHKGLEVDTSTRMQGKEFAPEDIAAKVVEKFPNYEGAYVTIKEAIVQFRDRFEMNPENYVGSEEFLGATLDGSRALFEDDPKCWYRGVIDYLEINDANIARVVDHKNYPTIMKARKLNGETSDRDIYDQLMGYVCLVFFNYPHVEQASYHVYHANPNMGGVTRDSSYKDAHGEYHTRYVTREEAMQWWRTNQERMIRQETKEPDDFVASPSKKECQYCDYPHVCPHWMDDSRDIDQEDVIVRDGETAKARLKKYVVLNEERKRIDEGLKSWAKDRGPIVVDGLYYGYKTKTSRSPHTQRILEAVAKDLDLDDDEGVERFIDKIAEKARLTKGSSKKVIRSIEDDALRGDTMEHGYVERESTRKTKDF